MGCREYNEGHRGHNIVSNRNGSGVESRPSSIHHRLDAHRSGNCCTFRLGLRTSRVGECRVWSGQHEAQHCRRFPAYGRIPCPPQPPRPRLLLAFGSGNRRVCDTFGHTPVSTEEEIPWKCRELVIGTGAYGQLPVMGAAREQAERRKVTLHILPTTQAIEVLNRKLRHTNAILHVTC